MAVYPESLVKISEASIRKVLESKGQNLKIWTRDLQYSEYDQSFIVGINVKTANGQTTSENIIIPAYDFIEKVADVIVWEYAELKNALTDSNVTNIFLGKDITLTDSEIILAGNKTILGINSILNLNGKTLTVGANNFDAYCKVSGNCTFKGTGGEVWLKDILGSSNSNPFTIEGALSSKGFERFVIGGRYTTYNGTLKSAGWTQKFKDNTFPLEDIITTINTHVQAEAEARANAIQTEAGLRSNEDTRLAGLISDETSARTNEDSRLAGLISDEKTRAETVEAQLTQAISDEANRATAAENDLRADINTLEGGQEGKYAYGINKANDGKLSLKLNNVTKTMPTNPSDDWTLPTVKATKDYVDACINAVYKPKGDAYVLKDASTNICTLYGSLDDAPVVPAANTHGFVYNIASLPNGEQQGTYTFKDSNNVDYTLEISLREDLGCINNGDDANPCYLWTDFGGKIDMSNYYTKSEVDDKSAAATTTIANANNDNIEVTSSGGSGGTPLAYHIHANVESISVDTAAGLSMSTGTTANHTTPKTISLNLANANDVAECVALFNNL